MAAGLGYKEFTTGDVLTAADANGYLASQVVMVFASAAARTSAIASPQEGMISYLKDTNSTEYYSGSAWAAIGAASASGLTLVKTQTIGSGVSSVQVTSAFNSTYDNYKIILSGGSASTPNQLKVQMGATTTGYYLFQVYGGYTAGTVAGSNYNNSSSWGGVGAGSTLSLDLEMTLKNPNVASETHYAAGAAQSLNNGNTFFSNGYLENNTQYTDFTIITSAGTLTGGTIRVYGYQNS
jgi:hypothetical protein